MATSDDGFPPYAALTKTDGWSHASGAPIRAAASALAPGRYIAGTLLGAGGMGTVTLARDARIGRDVAVKQLHADRELSQDQQERFLREARVQGQLEHPSIVPVYDVDEQADGATFFTMRRVLGKTLDEILGELRTQNAEALARHTRRELLTAFATVCLTVDYAHSRGVIHRDLKPANIMLGDFGEVYVLDWGIARLVGASDDSLSRLSTPGQIVGTPLYMAPEQRVSPWVDVAADVFSLGAILFEILTLERLRDPRALHMPVNARASERAPDRQIDPELETICVRATQADPADRYPTARAIQEAIVRYLEGDRELERRRQLARAHGAAARAALARASGSGTDDESERMVALREVVRALAFDPTDAENVAMFGAILATPPRTPPRAVEEELAAGGQQIVRSGARYVAGSSLLWFLFLPVVMAVGMRDPGLVALILVPIGLAAVLAGYAARLPSVPVWMQLATVGVTLLATVGVSRMHGPLVLVPSLLAVMATVFQAHPSRAPARVMTLLCATVLVGLPLLELAGLWTSSYHFENGTMIVVPQLHQLSEYGTYLLVIGPSLLLVIVPGMFISRLRAGLTEAQRQLLVQAWRLRRLGDELMNATAGAPSRDEAIRG